MLIICDFDGTVTSRDTNSALAKRFAPAAVAGLEGRLASRELTLRDVLTAEFADVTASIEELLEVALAIPFRSGFGRLLAHAERAGAHVVLLSSGFHELIEPMLAHAGFAGRVPLIANNLLTGAGGGRVTWRDLPVCALCDEPCKRHDVAQLRARHAGDGASVIYVGDGFSDRCGAEAADRVFARDSLATYLADAGFAYEPWEDFDQIIDVLELARGVAS